MRELQAIRNVGTPATGPSRLSCLAAMKRESVDAAWFSNSESFSGGYRKILFELRVVE